MIGQRKGRRATWVGGLPGNGGGEEGGQTLVAFVDGGTEEAEEEEEGEDEAHGAPGRAGPGEST